MCDTNFCEVPALDAVAFRESVWMIWEAPGLSSGLSSYQYERGLLSSLIGLLRWSCFIKGGVDSPSSFALASLDPALLARYLDGPSGSALSLLWVMTAVTPSLTAISLATHYGVGPDGGSAPPMMMLATPFLNLSLALSDCIKHHRNTTSRQRT